MPISSSSQRHDSSNDLLCPTNNSNQSFSVYSAKKTRERLLKNCCLACFFSKILEGLISDQNCSLYIFCPSVNQLINYYLKHSITEFLPTVVSSVKETLRALETFQSQFVSCPVVTLNYYLNTVSKTMCNMWKLQTVKYITLPCWKS